MESEDPDEHDAETAEEASQEPAEHILQSLSGRNGWSGAEKGISLAAGADSSFDVTSKSTDYCFYKGENWQ